MPPISTFPDAKCIPSAYTAFHPQGGHLCSKLTFSMPFRTQAFVKLSMMSSSMAGGHELSVVGQWCQHTGMHALAHVKNAVMVLGRK